MPTKRPTQKRIGDRRKAQAKPLGKLVNPDTGIRTNVYKREGEWKVGKKQDTISFEERTGEQDRRKGPDDRRKKQIGKLGFNYFPKVRTLEKTSSITITKAEFEKLKDKEELIKEKMVIRNNDGTVTIFDKRGKGGPGRYFLKKIRSYDKPRRPRQY